MNTADRLPRSTLIARLRTNPLLRALRVDKMTLAALIETLRIWAAPDRRNEIPLYAMLAVSIARCMSLQKQASIRTFASRRDSRAASWRPASDSSTLLEPAKRSSAVDVVAPCRISSTRVVLESAIHAL